MREQLLGYLLDALEPDERERLEEQLRDDPELQRDLEALDEALEPLRIADQSIEPPPGLARRTCRMVAAYQAGGNDRPPIPSPPIPSPPITAPAPAMGATEGYLTHSSLSDMIISAGVVMAAALLLLPALQQSRASARLNQCQDNLRRIGLAMAQYSAQNGGYYPPIGREETAGIYAVRLQEGGYLSGRGWNVCPAALHAGHGEADDGHVPTVTELNAASGPERVRLQRTMGGSYGYTLHYTKNGVYRCRRQKNRPTLAIMADAPAGRLGGLRSINHGCCGQNVLYDDGHVRCLCSCTEQGCRDHIYLNDRGHVAPGTDASDAVVASSGVSPFAQWIRLKAPRP